MTTTTTKILEDPGRPYRVQIIIGQQVFTLLPELHTMNEAGWYEAQVRQALKNAGANVKEEKINE